MYTWNRILMSKIQPLFQLQKKAKDLGIKANLPRQQLIEEILSKPSSGEGEADVENDGSKEPETVKEVTDGSDNLEVGRNLCHDTYFESLPINDLIKGSNSVLADDHK